MVHPQAAEEYRMTVYVDVEDASARAYPDFGDRQENETALWLALDEIAQGNRAWGCDVLQRLREHIRTTHEAKSVQWILPHAEAALQRFRAPRNTTTPTHATAPD
jgi:hypothetical protein